MHVVFDMDLTLVDESGCGLRPGIIRLLKSLRHFGVQMSLWTHSSRKRADALVRIHQFERFFDTIIAREDYAAGDDVPVKDIRTIGGDWLVDDQWGNIDYVCKTGRHGFLITPFWGDIEPQPSELETLHRLILPEVEFTLEQTFLDTIRDFMNE